MNRSLVRPRWLAVHAVAAALVVAFAALGWWQLGVYRDSDARQELRDRPPVPVAEIADPGSPVGGAADRPVTATGSYVAELVVPARVHDGVLGAYAVGVLETAGGTLTVLRGWAPDPDRIPSAPDGRDVTVSGHLVASESRAVATGPSPPPPGRIGYLAPEAVAAASGVERGRLYGGYLVLAEERPAPAAAPQRLDVGTVAPIRDVSPWQNLSYWAQWWVFAGAVVAFWVSAVRAQVKRRQATEPAPDGPPAPSPRPSVPR